MAEAKETMETQRSEESFDVKAAIKKADESMADIIGFMKDMHIEFEKKFNVLKNDVRDKDRLDIDPISLLRVAAEYPSTASWYLTEWGVAKTRHDNLKEAYEAWYGPRKTYAEAEMAKQKEHITQKTIEQKVGLLYHEEYKEWKDELLRAKLNYELLDKRLSIIHDARYSVQTTANLRDIWETTRVAAQATSRLQPAGNNLDHAQKEFDKINNTGDSNESN